MVIVSTRNLTGVGRGGVLMLNTCLTVRRIPAGCTRARDGSNSRTSHRNGRPLRRRELGEKSGVSRGVVFLAWGAWAAKRVAEAEQGACLCACWFESAPSQEEAPPRPSLFLHPFLASRPPLHTSDASIRSLLLSISQPSLHLHLSSLP